MLSWGVQSFLGWDLLFGALVLGISRNPSLKDELLCAVHAHILFSGQTAFAVLKRSAHIVIRCSSQIIVERKWTVKVYINDLIWGRLAKSLNVNTASFNSDRSAKGTRLSILENQRRTTQELFPNAHHNMNGDICGRRPYFYWFRSKLFVYDGRRRYYNQGMFYNLRCDSLNNKQAKFSGIRYFCEDLRNLRNEIQTLSKDVHPKILKYLNSNKNPVKDNHEDISKLVCLQQKLLSLYATKYGIHDVKTTKLANNYICSLAFRIHAVSELLQNPGCKTPGVDGVILKRAEYCEWVKHISYSNVFKHKVGLIKRVYIPKSSGEKRPLDIATIVDRLIQMLFVITYEPIIETVSDIYSFGFRKNRNAHQALGILFTKLHGVYGENRSFYAPRYVLNYDIEKFFDSVSHDWLMREFPAHSKHKLLIRAWLKAGIQFEKVVLSNHEGFPQGSVIGPLLANFTLNGLANAIKPDKIGYQNETKRRWLIKKGLSKEEVNKQCRVIIRNTVVRYADDFIIVTNCKDEVSKIATKVDEFLQVRGLKINSTKSEVIKLDTGRTFNFLGFTFKFIRQPKITRLTKRVNNLGQVIKPRTGLFIYVSNESVKRFKDKINSELKFLSLSAFQMILKLNPIIRGWANYFGIGSYATFGKIDGYIFRRCFRFIQKKFSRMGKRNIAINFFLHKVRNINWNFNAPIKKPAKRTRVFHAVLVRIRAMIRFISFAKLRPHAEELKNPFVYFEVKGKWPHRITRSRYKPDGSNIMAILSNKQKSICPICSEPLEYLNNSNLEIHHIKQRSLFSDFKEADKIENKQLLHSNCHRFISIENK